MMPGQQSHVIEELDDVVLWKKQVVWRQYHTGAIRGRYFETESVFLYLFQRLLQGMKTVISGTYLKPQS